MDSATWVPGEEPVVGCLTDEEATPTPELQVDDLESVVEPYGGTVATGDLEDVLSTDPSVLVVRGDSGLSAVARVGERATVLPVAPVTGIDAIDPDRLSAALAAVLEGEATVRERSLLEVESTGWDELTQALFDVALVTDEPARISEYGVRSRDGEVATFRADGVVVATPAGSHGYSSAVDAPLLSSAVDAVAAAPIAPFVTNTRRWVLPENVTLTLERNEGDVTLLADGRAINTVSFGAEVTITAAPSGLETLVVTDEHLESTESLG
ncbi:NAD(+)/NADH kinase [Natronobacterium gregoryi]|uniref:ATP-NAD kinase n=2 Tax=Natronobacterium gregoryi TaxID=44930 RepID=L0ACZ0_NATGS|nr:NAD(+)/NADH kinase [Natronobacterium gregoryi]AFZ71706.1 putative sugar kinase [Natronobacterium gregoryi SP2]ELY72722.1 ATP-NAD/AcoX kinase [Natronobacterium gregoryi SP2]PLK20246.1 ATP-NAD kinase [Natronobacterium gregoryi SP2]SFJ26182.1 NAD+ kinase [Natronobacterium gregoryi]